MVRTIKRQQRWVAVFMGAMCLAVLLEVVGISPAMASDRCQNVRVLEVIEVDTAEEARLTLYGFHMYEADGFPMYSVNMSDSTTDLDMTAGLTIAICPASEEAIETRLNEGGPYKLIVVEGPDPIVVIAVLML